MLLQGDSHSGGDSSAVASQLVNVQAIYGNGGAFAAVTSDNRIVCWGDLNHGGDCSSLSLPDLPAGKTWAIAKTEYAFAAYPADLPSPPPPR